MTPDIRHLESVHEKHAAIPSGAVQLMASNIGVLFFFIIVGAFGLPLAIAGRSTFPVHSESR